MVTFASHWIRRASITLNLSPPNLILELRTRWLNPEKTPECDFQRHPVSKGLTSPRSSPLTRTIHQSAADMERVTIGSRHA